LSEGKIQIKIRALLKNFQFSPRALWRELWYERRERLIVALSILFFILSIVSLVLNYWDFLPRPYQENVICDYCGFKEQREIFYDRQMRCSVCGKPVGQAYKCGACDYEFAVFHKPVPPEIKDSPDEIKAFRRREATCPNCGAVKSSLLAIKSKDKQPAK
jgi:hypothetical protein